MKRRLPAFTVAELLVAMTITIILLALLVQMLGTTQQTWQRTKSQAAAFRDARAAFESVTRQLSQATLNNYWDYNDPNNPTFYQRQSELHYVSGPLTKLLSAPADPAAGHGVFFQAPLGLDHLDPATSPGAGLDRALNGWGYFVQYNSDLPERPGFMSEASAIHPEKKRFRLMEFRLPTESFDLFKLPANAKAGTRPKLHAATSETDLYSWFRAALPSKSEAIAENILALVVRPTFPAQASAPDGYYYDTRGFQLAGGSINTDDAARRHQLPPAVRVALVALDEGAWQRLENADETATALVQAVNQDYFKNPADLDDDLRELSAELTALKLDHRIFSTTVPIRAAKWHSEKQMTTPTTP
ncbi:MAG TPA: Verru_Chthon cassette protein C [Verrucomicrobium sp.]|nr:Verru_Chthon cassette protein C [Verrucomicrobium sp.]